jgi:hypothetical protein
MKVLMKWRNCIFLLTLLMLLSGCRFGLPPADQFPWIEESRILFKDDFSKKTGGWTTHADVISFSGYAANSFRIWVDVPFFNFWSTPGLNFADSLIYVRAFKQAGPDNNLFGLICRYQNEDNFYALVIGSDGYYGILKKMDGEQMLVERTQMAFSEVINRGEAANELQASCQADQLALFVNGVELIQASDSSFAAGDVGVIAGNFLDPGADILFDDFIVVKP